MCNYDTFAAKNRAYIVCVIANNCQQLIKKTRLYKIEYQLFVRKAGGGRVFLSSSAFFTLK